MNTDAQNILPVDTRSAELTLAAQAQSKTPNETADEAIALLLGNCRVDDLRRSDNPRPAAVNPRRIS